MAIRVAEGRANHRAAAAHPIVVRDLDGGLLARGRTSNISETGVFLIAQTNWLAEVDQEVHICLTLPATRKAQRRDERRAVVYTARVVRLRMLGHMLGVGLELQDKIS